jgi:phospholipase C
MTAKRLTVSYFVLCLCGLSTAVSVSAADSASAAASSTPGFPTPIKHVVVILDENNSFDHYFGTYPNAANPPGEPAFTPLPNTPSVNGLTSSLLTNNPNSTQPYRLDRAQQIICDNDNHYADEQKAYNGGLLNKFPEATTGTGCPPGFPMAYYDGNTVTALWNYAQHFAMSDNFFDTEFGTTVMGHINLISGQTHTSSVTSVSGRVANGSIIANIEAGFDDCSPSPTIKMTGKNIGDLLNAAGVTWGWFYGDFGGAAPGANMSAICPNTYNNHYDPFQYYASTSNPHHLLPSSVAMIGQTDQANHQYDLSQFWNAAVYGTLPAVSFIKFPSLDTGHPNSSTALAEQQYLVDTINKLQLLPEWKDMAIMITYDDSDGWYDHVMPPIVSQSNDPANDALLGSTGLCGTPAPGAYLDRCGYGTRLPFLVISSFAKPNFVDSTLTDLTSILRFIEDNWNLGRIGDQSFDAVAGSILNIFNFNGPTAPPLFLDPPSGLPMQ